MDNKKENGNKVDEALLNRIRELVEQIQFGSVTLVIHDGRVVQIDQQQKIRLL